MNASNDELNEFNDPYMIQSKFPQEQKKISRVINFQRNSIDYKLSNQEKMHSNRNLYEMQSKSFANDTNIEGTNDKCFLDEGSIETSTYILTYSIIRKYIDEEARPSIVNKTKKKRELNTPINSIRQFKTHSHWTSYFSKLASK